MNRKIYPLFILINFQHWIYSTSYLLFCDKKKYLSAFLLLKLRILYFISTKTIQLKEFHFSSLRNIKWCSAKAVWTTKWFSFYGQHSISLCWLLSQPFPEVLIAAFYYFCSLKNEIFWISCHQLIKTNSFRGGNVISSIHVPLCLFFCWVKIWR